MALYRTSNGTSGLPGDWPEDILALGSTRQYGRRDVLFSEDQPADAVHLVLFGKVLRERHIRSDALAILDVHGRGDVLGLCGYLNGHRYAVTARAHTRVTSLVIPHGALEVRLRRDPNLARLINAEIARSWHHDLVHTASLATRPVEDRLRAVIADLAIRYGARGDVRGLLLDLDLTRRELGGLAGTTLETVIRTLNRLKADGLLITDGRRFFIPDVDSLQPR